jgi:imidazolonepropionase
MFDILLKNTTAITLSEGEIPRRGEAMRELGGVLNAYIGIDSVSGTISYLGVHEPGEIGDNCEVVDCERRLVLPGFVDPHTHLVFAGSRPNEFYLRAAGKTYLDISKSGGGIAASIKANRDATMNELVLSGLRHTWEMARCGTTTIEAKSGYGLSFEAEVKSLEAIREVSSLAPQEIVPTFLGAHAIPPEYLNRREEYLDLVRGPMMREIASRKLAEFVDVFVEDGAFSLAEGRRVLESAKCSGLGIRIHADEFTNMGVAALGVEFGAASVDHLGAIGESGITALADSDTVAILMPGTIFFVGSDGYAPARRLIDSGAAVALATDLNPGSSMIFSMPLVMTLAALKMRMTAEECITAATVNAAYSLGRAHRKGTLAPGKDADLIIFDVSDPAEIPYRMGQDIVSDVMIGGRWIKRNHTMLWRPQF